MSVGLFHERHRRIVLLAMLGGVYLPCISKIIPYRPVLTFLKGYAVVLVASLIFCGFMALRHTIFLADNLIVRIMAANNVFNDFLCSGRALLFNISRNNAQKLYDLWDEFFTNDGHDKERQELLLSIKKAKKKYVFGSGGMIQFMLVSWAMEQFHHENKEFSVPTGLPFNNTSPEYEIWAVFLFISFSLFGPMLLSVDSLIMEPLIWLSAELLRLKKSLAKILGVIVIGEDGQVLHVKDGHLRPFLDNNEMDREMRKVEVQLKLWIAEHQKVLIFHKVMVEVNHYPLALQLFCTTMTICMISFIVAMNLLNPFDTLVGLLFFIPNYVLFYITSTYGNIVEEETADIFTEAFATSWAVYPKRVKKMLHIVALRTNFTMEIKLFKMFPLGSKTYFQIVQTAYSFYSFLRFMTSKAPEE